MAVMKPPPASTRFGFSMPGAGRGPTPARPFSVWKKTVIPAGRKAATCGRQADAQVHQVAGRDLPGHAPGDDLLAVPAHDWALQEVIHQHARGPDRIGRDRPHGDDLVGLGDDRVAPPWP